MPETTTNPITSPADSVIIRKRDGRELAFSTDLITRAITAAFGEVYGSEDDGSLTFDLTNRVTEITSSVCSDAAQTWNRTKEPVDVESIQDMVETELMRSGEFKVARTYIVYREERNRARILREEQAQGRRKIHVIEEDGTRRPLNNHLVKRRIYEACHGLDNVDSDLLIESLYTNIFDGIKVIELEKAMVLMARQQIEREPAYDTVATRLQLNLTYKDVFGAIPGHTDIDSKTREAFPGLLEAGVGEGLINPELLTFDLVRLVAALKPERDFNFQYLGAQTIYDRYLIHIDNRRIETPQTFFMRVAMGLALKEEDREGKAIEFYNLLSSFLFMSATPTLFNSGTTHSQLSSCYLTSVDDDLHHIFKCYQDNALLSKWAGGLGNDWTRVRATGAKIKGTNGDSQGVIPFLKIANDTAIAVNQGGKRKGAVCAYLEVWHLDIEDFLELRKNTGDERRRCHDMHTANWIPDLFMKRVKENGMWTLFSPNEVPELHDLYGTAFEVKYCEYEARAERGEMRQAKQIEASTLWRKMLSMLFETGHPWITFKDPSNMRSPQDHAGVVHNSNLCTEILLNTSNDETAVCNLGSVNLAAHTTADGLDEALIAQTVKTAVRMLDNVIDINFYPTKEAENSNRKHRPIGLGLMGFQDALYIQKIPYASQAAVDFSDYSMEVISYNALLNSSKLAEERGAYSSYEGSKWDRGLLPIDTIQELSVARGGHCTQDTTCKLDWSAVRESIKQHGIRNSNVMAIAPTATISNIVGATQSIEPTFRNLFVKSNLSGDFTIVNKYLVDDLKSRDMWCDDTLELLKYHDGSLQDIEGIPQDMKALYQTSFEVDAHYLIECTSRRQKWVDMGISFNLYIASTNGRLLNDMYFSAWEKGLKTTYYLRSQAATQVEKSSININKFGIQPRWMKSKSASSSMSSTPNKGSAKATTADATTATTIAPAPVAPEMDDLLDGIEAAGNACSIDNPDCEACQ